MMFSFPIKMFVFLLNCNTLLMLFNHSTAFMCSLLLGGLKDVQLFTSILSRSVCFMFLKLLVFA